MAIQILLLLLLGLTPSQFLSLFTRIVFGYVLMGLIILNILLDCVFIVMDVGVMLYDVLRKFIKALRGKDIRKKKILKVKKAQIAAETSPNQCIF